MALRSMLVSVLTKEALDDLTNRLDLNGQVLTKNVTKMSILKSGIKLKFKKPVKRSQVTPDWVSHWVDVPEFNAVDNKYHIFSLEYDTDTFTDEQVGQMFGVDIKKTTVDFFYPPKPVSPLNRVRFLTNMRKPKYPIYIVSKGRAKVCFTADALVKMDVDFKIIVEEPEFNDYAESYGPDRLLILDPNYIRDYETYNPEFDGLKSKGPGPARNFAWNHAKESGAEWHWVLDDNMERFMFYFGDHRIKAIDGGVFSLVEEFVDRYDNVGISGMDYTSFVVPGTTSMPFVINSRIFSCLLIKNDLPIRWAGRYNEDVDICVKALKLGYSTLYFEVSNADKMATQTLGGGNTDAFYSREGTLPKSNLLKEMHPEITTVLWRYARWHHIVDFSGFDVYRKRTILDTVKALNMPPILDVTDPVHQKIIAEIKDIDFRTIYNWNILKGINAKLRDQVIDILKVNRWIVDNDKILALLTRPRVLNCDYGYYQLSGKPQTDSEDDRILVDLMSLGDATGTLTQSVDFDELLHYVAKEKRDIIAQEMVRNKFLRNSKPAVKMEYTAITLTEEEHKWHHDSLNYILNTYIDPNGNLPVPKTNRDMYIRGEKKRPNNKFKKNTVFKFTEHDKAAEYSVMIHGSEHFKDVDFFMDTIPGLIGPHVQEIINSVNYEVDLMAANYALKNKIPSLDFVPNDKLDVRTAYLQHYEQMANHADECILFLDSRSDITEPMQVLIDRFKELGKPLHIHIKSEVSVKTLF